MRLVSVVISTRSPIATRNVISPSTSSTCVPTGRISTSGSISPVGRTTSSVDLALRHPQFVRPRRRRDEDRARRAAFPFLELQRPVVQRRRQPEAELHQRFLARAVALVHGADLRNGDVRFVDHQQRIRRDVVEQARRRLAGHVSGEMARVVLDAVAVADLGHHLQVELRALRQPLRFDQLVLRVQHLQPLAQFDLDRLDRVEHGAARGHVMRLRIDRVARQLAQRFAGQRIEQRQLLDLAVEQLDPQRLGVGFRRMDVDGLAAHAVGAAGQVHLVARVLHLGQAADQLALVDALAARPCAAPSCGTRRDRRGRRSPTPCRR